MTLPTNACTISHKKVSEVADSGDSTLIQPSNWNDTHNLAGWGVIDTNTTITVGASGCDFTTVSAALAHLSSFCIKDGVLVTVEIQDQSIVESGQISVAGPYMDRVLVKGKTVLSKTLSSVQSVSGSAGAWSVVLNLADVADIAIGDYVAVPGSVTGGSAKENLLGVHVVSAVDAGNNRITVTTRSRSSSTPSGAISGSVKVLKSKLSFLSANTSGLYVTSGLQIQDFVLCGGSSGYGVYVYNGKVTSPAGIVCTDGFSVGVYGGKLGLIESTSAFFSGAGGNGVNAAYGATLNIPGCVVSGANSNSVVCSSRASISIASSFITGGAASGVLCTGGAYMAIAGLTVAYVPIWGVYVSDGAQVIGTSVTAISCTAGSVSPSQGSSGNNGAYSGSNA